VTWNENLPTGTSITVESATDGESFSTIASSGDPIPGLVVSQSLSGVYLTIKVTLATTVPANTPTFSSLAIEVVGQAASLLGGGNGTTLAPDGYFDFGQVKWTSGLNNGLAMEIKSWTNATRVIKLKFPMPFDIAVEDTFEIVPGCQKRFTEDCVGKFGNGVNHQGFPDVPGQDTLLRVPDQR
jgi:hypothetical protein